VSWRERRPQAEPPPRSVGQVVGRTAFSLRATRAVESGLFLVAAALLVRAAVEWQGDPDPSRGEVWALAVLTGALAALGWWREHPVSDAGLARELDGRLRHHGALLTAWELERRGGEPRPMERLVARRVLERLRLREALHAVLPPLFVPVAAPVAAALVLLLVIEARPGPSAVHADPARLGTGLELSLDEAIGRLRAAASDGLVDPAEAEAAIRRLRESLTAARATTGLDREKALTRLDTDLARLEASGREAAGPARESDWSSARAWLDALRQATPDGAPGTSRGTGGMKGAGLAPGPGNGIMSGSATGSESPPIPSVTPSLPDVAAPLVPPSAGPTGGGTRWWPSADDALVEAWLERSSDHSR
jgi:hypothetical protein